MEGAVCAAALSEAEAARACAAVAEALHAGRPGLARRELAREVVAGVGLLLATLAVHTPSARPITATAHGSCTLINPHARHMHCLAWQSCPLSLSVRAPFQAHSLASLRLATKVGLFVPPVHSAHLFFIFSFSCRAGSAGCGAVAARLRARAVDAA